MSRPKAEQPTTAPPFDPAARAKDDWDHEAPTRRAMELVHDEEAKPSVLAAMGDQILEGVPTLLIAPEDLAWFELDAKGHRLLDAIDGHKSVRTLLSETGLSEPEAITILTLLERQGVVALLPRFSPPACAR